MQKSNVTSAVAFEGIWNSSSVRFWWFGVAPVVPVQQLARASLSRMD
jgi:hypothetical protein